MLTLELEQKEEVVARLLRRSVSEKSIKIPNRLSASSDTTNTSVNVDTISFDDVNTRNELQRASDEVFMRSRKY